MSDRPLLGVVDGISDSGAALFLGDELVAAVNEERLTGEKLQGGFPHRAVDEVLRLAGVHPRDVQAIVVGGVATPSFSTRLFRGLQRRLSRTAGIVFDNPYSPTQRLADVARYRLRLTTNHPRSPLGRLECAGARAVLRRDLPPGLRNASLRLVDHHESHAASAFFASPFDSALVVCADSLGDGCSFTIHRGEGRTLRRLFAAGPFVSFGTFYALVTRYLGFRPYRHEGKVLALAASGDPRGVEIPFPLQVEGGTLRYGGRWGLAAWKWLERLDGCRREDVAAWLQRGLEEGILALLEPHLDSGAATDVCVAGGIFANVRLNLRLLETPGVRRLFVFPHMGDGGLAVGASLAHLRPEGWTLPPLFLGPGFNERACAAALAGVSATRPRDPERELAALLAQGAVVARFFGRMEYGPRALGHRSVLAEAKDGGIRQELNRRLCRTELMPFAPVTLREGAADRLEGISRAPESTRHMTCAFRAKPALLAEAPGAVHVDGTARAQIADPGDDEGLVRILEHYRGLTQRSTLINTSFNRHERPIVCTPDDAVRTFQEGGLDALLLGPFLLRRETARRRQEVSAKLESAKGTP